MEADISNNALTENFNNDCESTNMQNDNENVCNNLNSSDDDDTPRIRTKKQVSRFSDSESDVEKNIKNTENENLKSGSESDEIFKSMPQKSRIQKFSDNSSDSETSNNENTQKNTEQQLRIKNKRNKLRDKFKSLVTSRNKDISPENSYELKHSGSEGSDNSDEDLSSVDNIKKMIKERLTTFKSTVCDPDTSDEEEKLQKIYKQKKPRKTKPTSPKPQRMSAKQAMENMHKIKSESNRMLREKEVSLPYHRPKALSLKDIMSRRQTAIASNGKTLPIKMNEDQLKEYAKMLEERQKKMMELFQSDDEDEQNDEIIDDNKITESIEHNNSKETNEVNSVKTDTAEIFKNSQENKDVFKESDRNFDEETNEVNSIKTDTVEIVKNSQENKDVFNESDRNFDDVMNNHINNTDIEQVNKNGDIDTEEQDSETNMELVFNESSINEDKLNNSKENSTSDLSNELYKESIEDTNIKVNANDNKVTNIEMNANIENNAENTENIEATERDSQLISLQFDSEPTEKELDLDETEPKSNGVLENSNKAIEKTKETDYLDEGMEVDGFSDEDVNMDDIDNIIENAEIIKEIEDKVNSPLLIRDRPLNIKPKLTGAPGMVIDLDGTNAAMPRKSGVQLLKERFTFFSKLKTPEELEREKEKKIKPGTLHLKLKQQLEEQIAEQRSLEWAKRLEEEKQQQDELKALRGEEDSGDENDIDKIEAKLEGIEEETKEESESEEEEEELVEDDCEMKDKPRSSNPMIDSEAEESDCDDVKCDEIEHDKENGDEIDEEEQSDSEESDESSESEEEAQPKERKHRILKAFEDSDDDEELRKSDTIIEKKREEIMADKNEKVSGSIENILESQGGSQDDVIQLAQRHKLASEELFTTQETISSETKVNKENVDCSENDIDSTQSFSIMESKESSIRLNLNNSGSLGIEEDVLCKNDNLEAIASVNLENLTQNLPPLPIPTTQLSQSQALGEDVLALCTGNFYDNQFVSESEINQPSVTQDSFDDETQRDIENNQSQKEEKNEECRKEEKNEESQKEEKNEESQKEEKNVESLKDIEKNKEIPKDNINEIDDEISNTIELKKDTKVIEDDNLKSILDELHDPEFDSPKPNKYFLGNQNTKQIENQIKKKFVIDSDDENNDFIPEQKKRKKLKKKKLEQRALQISDDEEDELEEQEDYESEIDDDPDRIVEYDSEENEIEIKPDNPKKKRKVTDFFENEAELTSEDEWVGSGDEDEAGLDRMEREEGDDETFHQGKLQRELGQIHMRDVLDQDKREVRIIQELLFEDGDLGSGSRQRKFRWKNNDGDDDGGTNMGEFGDSQEDEFESEEQWRKQRHEREVFLREMQKKDEPNDNLDVSINRTSIIKANLCSKTMSSLLLEVNQTKTEINKTVPEKRTLNDIPSPKKPFGLLQPTYQGSLLNRGRSTLARLAALATPLAVDDDAPKVGSLAPSSKRNFVFAALTPEEAPKVTKRKAEYNPTTPKLVKKMKTEEKHNISKISLLDHMKV